MACLRYVAGMTESNHVRKLNPRKKDALSFAVSLAITVVFFLSVYFFGGNFVGTMWVVVATMLGLILLVIWILAGFAVVRSLFFVAAELSLLIFLAQSYCAVPEHSAASDAALKTLGGIGLVYIALGFFRSLYKAARDHYKTIAKDNWSAQKVFTVAFFLMFAGLFTWQVYLVMKPIVLNLCVLR